MIKNILAAGMGMIMLLSTGVAYANHDTPPKTQETYEYMELLQDVFERIRNHYVDKINDKEVLEAAINGMMKSLDPHSSYMSPRAFVKMQTRIGDSFTGIGAELTEDEDTKEIKVVRPIKGSPAEKAGILANDIIKTVNGTSVSGKPIDDAVKLIRGAENTAVILGILRDTTPLKITIIRGKIKQQTVVSKMLPDNIGYVRAMVFNEHVSDSVKEKVLALSKKHKLKGLVLDLRNNPGGLLHEAISMTDLFVNHGLIVMTKGRDSRHHHEEADAHKDTIIPTNVPIVVLVNKGSASASEIVSGSLQDLKRATVVGVKSYGKGSVQSIMPLKNGGALRLTTAKYYTTSGRVIHGVGIIPDITVEIPDEYKPVSNEPDPQLKKAIEVINKSTKMPNKLQ